MPTGMSTAGFFTSSARVDTQSNPMKEKNTNEAPLNIPLTLRQQHQNSVCQVSRGSHIGLPYYFLLTADMSGLPARAGTRRFCQCV